MVTSLSIHKYETLIKIVELGNITKAAMALGYSQSAVSHMVSSLENEWNVKLLIRDSQGVTLTREGELLFPTIQRIVTENKSLLNKISELHNLEKGTIHLGAFPSALINFVPKLIKSFTAAYPQIQFIIRQGGYKDIEQQIFDGHLDCGFVRMPTFLDIDTIPLLKERLLAVFPEGAHSEQGSFPLQEIEHESLIMERDLEHETLDLIQKNNINIGMKYASNYDYSILSMIANGLGMCILPELMLQDTPYHLTIKELDPPAFRTIAIAYNREYLSPAAHKFVQHVQAFQQLNSSL